MLILKGALRKILVAVLNMKSSLNSSWAGRVEILFHCLWYNMSFVLTDLIIQDGVDEIFHLQMLNSSMIFKALPSCKMKLSPNLGSNFTWWIYCTMQASVNFTKLCEIACEHELKKFLITKNMSQSTRIEFVLVFVFFSPTKNTQVYYCLLWPKC